MDINKATKKFKTLINNAIKKGGNKDKIAIIRSSKPILNIHEAIKCELVKRGVSEKIIFPPLGERSPELKLAGALKQKDQDICATPNIPKMSKTLTGGLLDGTKDEFGKEYTEKTLVINVRSQISSIQKNFDTLFERTYAEAHNLHERCPNMVLGEVYLLAVPEYNEYDSKNKKVSFKNVNQRLVEKYIKSFKSITDRSNTKKDAYKYESTCLLIIDFSKNQPKLYNSTDELKADSLLSDDTDIVYEGLDWENFFEKIISVYDDRFGIATLT